jgi:hypothetical protein
MLSKCSSEGVSDPGTMRRRTTTVSPMYCNHLLAVVASSQNLWSTKGRYRVRTAADSGVGSKP